MADPLKGEPLNGEPLFAMPIKSVCGVFLLLLVISILTVFLPLENWGAAEGSGQGLFRSSSLIVLFLAAIFFAMQPWQRRPASDWMLWWLGGAVIRILGAPIVLISIYFSSHLPAASVMVGGVIWAVVGLLSEAVIVAKSVSRQTASTRSRQSQ